MTELDIKPFVDADSLENGQIFTFLDEGEYKEINVGTEEKPETKRIFQITIETGKIEYLWTMNNTSQVNFVKQYGKDTSKWVGKQGKFTLVQQNVFGNIKMVVYGMPIKKEKK